MFQVFSPAFERASQLSLTAVWILVNFQTKFNYGRFISVNSHISFFFWFEVVLGFPSSTYILTIYKYRQQSYSCSALFLPASHITLWKSSFVFFWLALPFSDSTCSFVLGVTWLVLKYSVLDVHNQICTQYLRWNFLRPYLADAGTIVSPYHFGASWHVWGFLFSHFQAVNS